MDPWRSAVRRHVMHLICYNQSGGVVADAKSPNAASIGHLSFVKAGRKHAWKLEWKDATRGASRIEWR